MERKLYPSSSTCRFNNFLSLVCCVLLFFMYFTYQPSCLPQNPPVMSAKILKRNKYQQRATTATTTTTTTKSVTSPEVTTAPATKGVTKTVDFIDIIGIGIYTWHHLLNGSLDVSDDKQKIYNSTKTIDGITFKYKLKCCYPSPSDDFTIDNEGGDVILALWGRSEGRTQTLKLLRRLLADKSIKNLALLVFGDLGCNDDYLTEMLKSNKLKFVYITHESNMIDGKKVFLWPLGTQMAAGHKVRRNCPYINPKYNPLDLDSVRKFTSTFIGSIWDIRKPMEEVIKKNKEIFDNEKHLLSFLPRWKNQSNLLKTKQVGDVYEYSLINSDLTLSPRGRAAECYRTFEALEFGSIPVISNIVQKSCIIPHEHNETIQSPNRIFKLYDAPVYYVNDWARDIPTIMREFEDLSPAEKSVKRRRVHEWYRRFKIKMGWKVIDDVNKFFV